MTEMVAYRDPAKSLELVYDTDDVAGFRTPCDVLDISCKDAGCPGCGALHRKLGAAHLNLTFKPGKRALWREVAPDGPV
jgi:hypothetical protein